MTSALPQKADVRHPDGISAKGHKRTFARLLQEGEVPWPNADFEPIPPIYIIFSTALEPLLQPPTQYWGLTMDIQRFLIGLGLVILAVAIVWPILSRIGLGRLPGDIMYERHGTTFYFPLATCIIISVVLSVVFWLFNR